MRRLTPSCLGGWGALSVTPSSMITRLKRTPWMPCSAAQRSLGQAPRPAAAGHAQHVPPILNVQPDSQEAGGSPGCP